MTPPAAATVAGRRVARQPEDEYVVTRNPRRASAAVREPEARPQPRERARPATRPSSRAAAAAAALEASLAPTAPVRSRRQPGSPASAPARPRREVPARQRSSASRRTRTAPAPRLAMRLQPPRLDRIVRGRAWIPVLAAMLVAIVGLRVAVLKLGSGVGSQIQQATLLESSNATLRSQISALSDNQRIEKMAEAYGMHMPSPLDVHFVRAGSARQVQAAINNISAPANSTFLTGLAAEQQGSLSAAQQTSSLSAVGSTTGATSSSATTSASTGTASSSTTAATSTTGGSAVSGAAAGAATTGQTATGASTPTSGAVAGATGTAGTSSSGGASGSAAGTTATGNGGTTLNTGPTNTAAGSSGAASGASASTGGTGLAG